MGNSTTCGVQNSLHKERYDQVSCWHICNKRGQYRPSSTWVCFVILCYLYCCIVLNKCLIQAIVLLSFPVNDNEDDYSCKCMFNQLVPLLYSSHFFCILHTGMLSLISVELHKMFRWFVSSIILHHAQYIEWFSNHSSSPWATGLYVWMVLPASAIKKGKKKDKKRDGCFTCGSEEHWANKCPNKYLEARTWLQVCQCHSKQQWWGI